MKYSVVIAIIPIFLSLLIPNVYAGGPDTAEACYDQGREKPFQRGNYDACDRFRNAFGDEREAYDGGKNPYYEGFIDGCKSVEGNTEEVCERATD